MREYGKQQRGQNGIHVLPINQGKSATLPRYSSPQGHSAEQMFDKTPDSTLDDPSLNPHLQNTSFVGSSKTVPRPKELP